MPDRRKSGFSKPNLVALVVVVTGVLAMTVALLSGTSSPNSDNPGQKSDNRAIEPVDPLNPNDSEAKQPPADAEELSDPTDPFATSFGAAGRREVTVRVSGNGVVNVGIYYRDKKAESKRAVSGSYSETRTFKGKFPMVSVVIQLPGNIPGSATRASCTIEIDGIEVAEETATQAGALTNCNG